MRCQESLHSRSYYGNVVWKAWLFDEQPAVRNYGMQHCLREDAVESGEKIEKALAFQVPHVCWNLMKNRDVKGRILKLRGSRSSKP